MTLPVRTRVNNAYSQHSSYLLKRSGWNIGNLVFRKGLQSIIRDLDTYSLATWDDLPGIAFDKTDRTVISCANWLGMSSTDEISNRRRADLLEGVKGRCIAVGLGIQALGGQRIEMGPETIRLAKTLSIKCSTLSVRDDVTLRALADIGINNAITTGCPSNFINLALSRSSFTSGLGRGFGQATRLEDLRLMISEISLTASRSSDIIRKTMEILAKSRGSSYVLQTPILIPFLYGECDSVHPRYRDGSAYKSIIQHCGRVFSGVDDWLFASRFSDLSFGMRIHGTMVPLQAGVPSILLAHDQRTAGLACAMCVPHLTVDEFLAEPIESMANLMMSRFFSELEQYFIMRERLAGRFLRVLEACGFQPRIEFERLGQISEQSCI